MPEWISRRQDWKVPRQRKAWCRVLAFEVGPPATAGSRYQHLVKEMSDDLTELTRRLHEGKQVWEQEFPPRKPPRVIPCVVVEMGDGPDAVCSMTTGEWELTRVSFPAWVLRRKGLGVGARFHWIVRNAACIQSADIDTEVAGADEMTAPEKAALDALFEEAKRSEEEGGCWKEITGDSE